MAEATTKKETAPTKKQEEEKMVKIFIPKVKMDEEDEFVSVNERTFLVKKGMEVEVPACVAEVIRNRDVMRAKAYENASAHAKKG